MSAGSLRDLIPDDHVLARVDRVLDLGWLRAEVAEYHAAGSGRPGIDPEASVDIAIRWFAGYGLAEALPDHSSLTRIRQRWGAERFRRRSTSTVPWCGPM